ncbi:MAG: DNA-formamidopyrimidine glycosylase [Microcoleus sp. PH2017_10_PVI_O_A]|uniref:DNA-formamidopyrimidine glycosylase n=1 Tax=unclassified Microcoleus TaxID=2642155 RepID=UPI001DF9AD40|nr:MULTISPECIES: DNA-formamidopyrimidine glycosylase [unclassified Microcoleus]TAE78374.1 MAG: DNA-formamidopyrimidine glycosylase [Oscillatoriales cyanobacterium]MCC3405987.1 DNA-formamidopyrimidine glycosylase [Microcoleus sp. PH2017_10_PVI_O_A]MCC3460016.1 DNA-formamidopyrimidine glycosylase [Microcoleus sp. PH2017_11_PCY_U_A]MCC3478516.1 DNA-formamidopyrimidine glycosylase [Microcoleus sp. PH2017_12_PCY_D_A]MCC3531117.1 DNA-formamidopyrimidine glycosylase [Microcoleus sp. PH2017_21_RUC_O_A
MPELPEVETICRGLNQLTLDREILGGDVLLHSSIARSISATDFLTKLKGKSIERWYRRGKYLLAELSQLTEAERETDKVGNFPTQNPSSSLLPSKAGWLGVHLRMTGQLLWVNESEPLPKHARVRLFFAGNQELRFVDQRTFGQMWYVPAETEVSSTVTGLKLLGPEPFSDEFTTEYLAAKLHRRARPIKTALLDQSLVAGLGNIYADETLFLSGVMPTTLCADLTREQIDRIHTAIIQVLQRAIASGGTTFSNFLNVQGVNGNYGGVAWVYNRAGQPCRTCSTTIERIKLAGRSTHFCPACQK